jgi:hypothetical protein
VKSGDMLTLLVITKSEIANVCIEHVAKLLTTADLRFQITYESMYEESFTYTGSGQINDAEARQFNDVLSTH